MKILHALIDRGTPNGQYIMVENGGYIATDAETLRDAEGRFFQGIAERVPEAHKYFDPINRRMEAACERALQYLKEGGFGSGELAVELHNALDEARV